MLTEGWIEIIMEYNFSTEYLPGKENDLADALSRCYEGTVKAVTVDEKRANLEWEAEKRGYKLPNKGMKEKLMEEQHALGHFGVKLMVEKIKEAGYWWPGMRIDLKRKVRRCQACLCYNIEKEGFHPAKSITAKLPWDHLQIDLIGPLPVSEEGYTYILTVVDVCTAYTVIRALKNKEMETVAQQLWMIFCEYGTPKIMQSDNGLEFVNRVMKAMTVIHGIDHRLITAYHPSANGQVERRNKEVSKALKKFTEGTYAAWQQWLPLVQISLNEAISERTGSAAFALMYNRRFNEFRDFSKIDSTENWDKSLEDVKDSWKEFKDAILPGIEMRTNQTKQKQEERLNERKQFETLKSGTKVMVLDQHRSSKWEPIYEGPYEIVRQDQGGAYVLKDELGEIMEPKRTIEMLKPIEDESTTIKDNRDSFEIEKLLDHKLTKDGYEYLVKWKGYSEKDNSWVKAKDFNGQKMLVKYWRGKKKKNSTSSLGG